MEKYFVVSDENDTEVFDNKEECEDWLNEHKNSGPWIIIKGKQVYTKPAKLELQE
jgi:hypothetical protein